MALPAANSSADLCPPESFVNKAVAMRAQYHLLDFIGKSEWTITQDVVAPHLSNRNGVGMNRQRLRKSLPAGILQV